MVYRPKNTGVGISPEATLLFFIAHIFIALFVRTSTTFSTIYALTVFLVGVMATLTRRSILIVSMVAYITGAEVLFRMTGAGVFWEFGKYATSAILILALLTRRERKRWPWYFILYFILLLPAILKTPYISWTQWRIIVSYIMSGPLSICICGLYFSGLSFDKSDLRRIFSWFIAPIICVTVVVLLGVRQAAATGIEWAPFSLKLTSGGFGPNQVCSILGLGAYSAAAVCILAKGKRIFKIIFIPVIIWFLSHAILTFSRGGVLGSTIPFLVFLVFMVKSKKNRLFTLCLGIFLVTLNHYYIIPKLDQFTKGMLFVRYAGREQIGKIKVIHTTGRVDYMLADIQAFKDNFLSGVGVGNSMEVHYKITGIAASPHTEWTRTLAEHGVLGLLSLIFLWAWFLKRYRSLTGPVSKAIVISLILAIIIYMGHSATRLIVPAFLIGLLSADLKPVELEQ